MDLKELEETVQVLADKLDDADHYELLGVSRDATTREIKRSFLQFAKKYHPDRYANVELGTLGPKMQNVLARLSHAHTVLTNPEQRAAYDQEHPPGGGAQTADVSKIFEAEEALRAAKRLLERNDYGRASRELQRAQALNPDGLEYDAYLAWCEYAALDARKKTDPIAVGKFTKRIETVLEEFPKSDALHVFLASITNALGDTRSSLRHYKKAAEINPHNNVARSHVRIMQKRAAESKVKPSFFGRFFGKKK